MPEVLNTVVTMTRWLRRRHPDATVFPIAEEPLWRALAQAGIRTSDKPEEIDLVVASYDRGFDYRKLQIAFDAIWYHRRARLVTTNPDRWCPFPGGRGEPDAGAIVAAIEACTGGLRGQRGQARPADAGGGHGAAGPGGHRLRHGRRPALHRHPHGPDRRHAVGAGPDRRHHRRTAGRDPAAAHPTWVLDRIDRLLPASAWAGSGPA